MAVPSWSPAGYLIAASKTHGIGNDSPGLIGQPQTLLELNCRSDPRCEHDRIG
jgi:hypothetical protein